MDRLFKVAGSRPPHDAREEGERSRKPEATSSPDLPRKKKVVVKLDIHDRKDEKKAMKGISGISGVDSVSVDMKDGILTVIGDVDPVIVVRKLKKTWHTELLSVGPAEKPDPKERGPATKPDPKERDPKAIDAIYNPYIRQHYEMFGTCVDSDLAELSSLEELSLISRHSSWLDQVVDEIQSCTLGLRCLRMFFWSLLTMEDTDSEIRQILIPVNLTREAEWGKSRKVAPFPLVSTRSEYDGWILDLQGRIEHSKGQFEESCELLLHCSLRCNSFQKKHTRKFLGAILENLKDLYWYKNDEEVVLLKNQISTLEKKLTLLHDLFNLTHKQWRSFKEMQEFKVVVHAFAHYSANLVFMYWVKEIDEEMATKLNLLLFNVMQKYKLCVPVFKAFYIRFLKETKLMQFDHLLLGQIIQIVLDLLLENLVDILKDDFQVLQESLMFVIAFLVNPPDQYADDKELMLITAEIEVLVTDDLSLVLSVDDTKENFSKADECLSDFMRKVELVKGKIQHVYHQIWDSFSYDFPKTNGLGFFDFLLQNLGFLKEKLKSDTNFIPFAKHLIIKIEEELMSLRPYLSDLFEQQKEHKELEDTWLEVMNLAYRTEYAINSCSVIGHQLWYNMARLMEALDEIKVVRSKLKRIEGRRTHDGGVLRGLPVAKLKPLEDPRASGFNEVTVGLENEADEIVENLVKGSSSLDIVAIVGMPGLGKTTLANKVYNSSVVRSHFDMCAYCIVSQVHNARRILLDILSDITKMDDNKYYLTDDDLAHALYTRLKGRRYLIIMDDIWDVKAWDEVKRSFPNDKNGSRVIFTTRIPNVALQAKSNCMLHHLRFMSNEESWELLLKMAFPVEGCPPDLLEVGKMIAKNCKGLPLAIVVIAGLLARSERSLSGWNKISEAIGSYNSTEGCMDVIELSFHHLPEHLKPCFLYFGVFAENTLIRANKLTLLWIAEGFVHNSNKGNLKNVAKRYLCDLIDRSLVFVNERSSNGGIKSCHVHDLLHAFCQRKAQEENFFHLMHKNKASISPNSTIHDPYRVCIHMKGRYPKEAPKICPNIHSLLSTAIHDVGSLKLVQVMDLKDLIRWGNMKLVHLRFLAGPTILGTRIPHSISNMWNLEILILTGRSVLELPRTIWNMTRLRHVDVGQCYLSNSGVKKGEAYPQMVNLESFSSPTIYSSKDLEDLLQRSPSLQKLSFHYEYEEELEKISQLLVYNEPQKDFHFPNLDSLSKLESLKVSSTKELRLHPFEFPSTIRKLTLSGGYLPWVSFPVINNMPCLEVLKLLNNAFVGLRWNMEDAEFPGLKYLKLELLDLAEWIVDIDSFPCLEVLIVNKCYGLDTIPPCFGEVSKLKRIEFYGSPLAATSVAQIHEDQYDGGNDEFVAIVEGSMLRYASR